MLLRRALFKRPDELGDAAGLRQSRLALLGLVEPLAVADHQRQRAPRVRGNLDRHRLDDVLAAIAAQQHLERHGAPGARPRVVEPDAFERGGPRLLGRLDGDVESLDLDALVVVVDERRDRRR